MAMTKKPGVRKPAVKRPSAKPAPLAPAPKRVYPRGIAPAPMPKKPSNYGKERIKPVRPAPPKTKKTPGNMTPQDSAMKKILEKKYGKIYG